MKRMGNLILPNACQILALTINLEISFEVNSIESSNWHGSYNLSKKALEIIFL